MRLESIGLRHIQAGSVLVDGWIETMYRLHEHFDIGCRTTSTQRDGWVLGLVASTVVDLSEALQHREIKWRCFPRRQHTIHIGHNQTDHRCGPSTPRTLMPVEAHTRSP
jgi:hypothetical protein